MLLGFHGPRVRRVRDYPRSSQATGWDDPIGTAGSHGSNEGDHACLRATAKAWPTA